ncbi:PBSX family phage terminase large subunit [Desemzia sp. C1]|uniref:PBSX family phage terminase large subunit n=1 Tax=unclassified Desemzia TaxID=2685243 RepID=UPI001E41C2AD|nr:PBSX family phage terminase large subunit [Desemzia sp. C1]MCI3027701.1 PBSX family phage terminase large subunit [Desemzia sp. C1]
MKTKNNQKVSVIINLPKKIGKGYGSFWRSQKRYLVVKGGRGSKKSTTAAQKIIYNMMKYPLANTLVLRRFFNTHKDSTYTQLKWATRNLGVAHLWHFSKSPLEATYIPTGQKILFRGLDDPESITSITVEVGFLCWAWFEEVFQIRDEDAFNKIDMSIRGELPPGYFKQLIMTFNPWSENHWLKPRFFDDPDKNTLSMTTNYLCNEFLGDDDIDIFKMMKKKNPRRYNIEGMGNWGIADGLVYENWKEEEFDYSVISKKLGVFSAFGLDFGFTNDPTAFIAALVDPRDEKIYIFDEWYKHGQLNKDIAKQIKYMGYNKERIIADGAAPKDIEDLKQMGLSRIKGSVKGKDSINHGIQKIQGYEVIVHPRCENTLVELTNYVWDNKDGSAINKPIDDFNHLMDAFRYAMESVPVKKKSLLDRYKTR